MHITSTNANFSIVLSAMQHNESKDQEAKLFSKPNDMLHFMLCYKKKGVRLQNKSSGDERT
jgi:hypothetical protein